MSVTDDDLRARNSLKLAKALYYVELEQAGLDVYSVPLFDDLKPSNQCQWFEKSDMLIAAMEDFIG